jgi:hypothetical protein
MQKLGVIAPADHTAHEIGVDHIWAKITSPADDMIRESGNVIKRLLARDVLQPDDLKKICKKRFVEYLKMNEDYGTLLTAIYLFVPRVFENEETADPGRPKKNGNMIFNELIRSIHY